MTWNQVVGLHPGVLEQPLQLVVELLHGLLVRRGVADPHVPVTVKRDAILRSRQVLRREPEVNRMAGHVLERTLRRELGLERLLAAVHVGRRLADHLDVAERKFEVVAAEVEVVQPEGLLEDGRVLFLGERQHGLAVVERVVAPELVGAVGQAVRVLVVGRGEQQLGRVRRAARDHHDVGRVRLALALAFDLDLRHGGAGTDRSGAREPARSSAASRSGARARAVLRAPPRRTWRAPGTGSRHRSSSARSCCTACSPRSASPRRGRGTDGAQRRRGRPRAAGSGARARPPGTGRERSTAAPSGPRPARRAPGRAARPACSRAPSRRSRSATPAIRRRGAGARRSPSRAGGRAPRRRASSRRRRSSAPEAGMPLPSPRRTRCPARCSDCRRTRRARPSSAARA